MDERVQHIGLLVVEEAMDRFEACRAASDFCIQSLGQVVVFGSTNRVTWSPTRGWSLDRSYCTDRFKILWDSMYGSQHQGE